VLAAVLACARPVLVTAWRTARWDQRVVRAVVLDTSSSMAASEASRLADGEMRAFAAARFAGDDLDDQLKRAAEWLQSAPPARREVVVVSDFQRGAIDAASLSAVPSEVGLRFIRAGGRPPTRGVRLPPVSGWRNGEWQGTVTLRGDRLDAVWSRRGPAIVSWLTTKEPAADADVAARAVRAAASLGVASNDDGRRAVVAFEGAPAAPGAGTVTTPWMLRAAAALQQSPLLRESGAGVSVADDSGALLVRANVSAASAAAPAVVRAVMVAVRPAAIADPEVETTTLSDAQLTAWRRDPAPAGRTGRVTASDSIESKWLWGAALLLMALENLVRRGPARAAQREARADAA
jgi:hypothetical protein